MAATRATTDWASQLADIARLAELTLDESEDEVTATLAACVNQLRALLKEQNLAAESRQAASASLQHQDERLSGRISEKTEGDSANDSDSSSEEESSRSHQLGYSERTEDADGASDGEAASPDAARETSPGAATRVNATVLETGVGTVTIEDPNGSSLRTGGGVAVPVDTPYGMASVDELFCVAKPLDSAGNAAHTSMQLADDLFGVPPAAAGGNDAAGASAVVLAGRHTFSFPFALPSLCPPFPLHSLPFALFPRHPFSSCFTIPPTTAPIFAPVH